MINLIYQGSFNNTESLIYRDLYILADRAYERGWGCDELADKYSRIVMNKIAEALISGDLVISGYKLVRMSGNVTE